MKSIIDVQIWDALILGVVQGLTEFLPISSSGHLVLFQNWLIEGPQSLSLDVVLHVGTFGSILVFFRKDLIQLIHGVLTVQPEEKHRALLVIGATVPTGVIGLFLKDYVEHAAASVVSAGIGFFVSAFFLWMGEKSFSKVTKTILDIPWKQALLVGIIQGMAVWPGISRSGSTIAMALFLGWSWREAGRLSFFMALPAIAGATLLTLKDMGDLPLLPAFVGFFTAFFVGCLSLSILMRFLAARRLWPFAVYCFLLGLLSVGGHLLGLF